MRKLLCFLLVFASIFAFVVPANGAVDEVVVGYKQPKPDDLLDVKLTVYSNLTTQDKLAGLYFDNVFYIDSEAICLLTGAECISSSDNKIALSLHDGIRKPVITSDCRLTEKIENHQYNMDIPTATVDGILYVSAAHILRFLGATVEFAIDAHAETHMSVSMPYTVFDAYADYCKSSSVSFSWSEADGKFVDPDSLIWLAEVDTIYFGYDKHLIAQMIPAYRDNVMAEYYSDVLLDVLTTNEENVVDTSVFQLYGNLADAVIASNDWINDVLRTTKLNNISEVMDVILKTGEHVTVTNALGVSMAYLKITDTVVKALNALIQYDSITDAQINTLANSLLRIEEDCYLYDEEPRMYKAITSTNEMVNNAWKAAQAKLMKGIQDCCIDAVTGAVPILNSVSTAINVSCALLATSDLFQKLLDFEQKISYANVAKIILTLGQGLLDIDAVDLSIGQDNAASVQQHVRADMIISLKASLLIRKSLIACNILKGDAEDTMAAKIQELSILLNKVENASYLTTYPDAPVIASEDLTWIAKLVPSASVGYAVLTGRYTYYWQYQTSTYETGALVSNFDLNKPADMVRVNKRGETQKLFSATASKFAVTATHIIYQNNGILYSRLIDGTKETYLTPGELISVSTNGQYIVYSSSGGYFSYDLWSKKSEILFANGNFEAIYNDTAYFTEKMSTADARKGKVVLWAVKIDGSLKNQLYQTSPDLYSDSAAKGYSAAQIEQIRFTDEHIYFSYGSTGGSGGFFQGGRIVRINYDGTNPLTMAGKNSLVNAEFSVSPNGAVHFGTEYHNIPFYNGHQNYCIKNGTLYWQNTITGEAESLMSTYMLEPSIHLASGNNISICVANEERVLLMVDYTEDDPSQAMGWRNYSVRIKTVVYLLDRNTQTLTELYSF